MPAGMSAFNVARLLGCYNVVTHAYTSFLPMYLWEHFGALAPNQIQYSTTIPREAGGVASPRGATNMYRLACYNELV